MINRSINSTLGALVLTVCFYLASCHTLAGQDVAERAMRARNHLYESWNFDSVAYYLDRVIGEKYAPAFAYSDYGWYLMLLDRYEEGLTYIQRAAEMDPTDKQLAAWNAWALLWDGEMLKARQWIRKALTIDPNDGEALYISSLIASEMGNHEGAIRLAGKAASRDPNYRASVPLAMARAGKREAAIARAQKIAENENVFDTMILMEVYGYLKKNEKALHYMQKSYELRHPFMPWLEFVPGTTHLQDDPRFRAIVRKMNLPK